MKYHAIKERFNGWVKWKYSSDPVLETFILNHERKDLVINNLCREIDKLGLTKHAGNMKRYAEIIDTYAGLFAKAALREREELHLSEAEKNRRISEAGKLNELEEEQKELRDEFFNPKIKSYGQVKTK